MIPNGMWPEEEKPKNFDYYKEVKTKTYVADKGYMVDIITTCATYSAYIYHRDYGIKILMFGMPKKQQSYEEFLKIVDINFEGHKKQYEREVIEKE